ncbi:redoxin domain-containing protein [Alienimonas californiensis]|uniref:AhpC/TSA family protein n=1 Tax=Alienimonas californiensis TaxID=2527989 RepID=A0A517P7C3_9PLAN|nr:redoxin domain-containing protein [Alienimonas californiensis]QDT15278.1 AhpC/TSA family protein [Alienimonas californiensis]
MLLSPLLWASLLAVAPPADAASVPDAQPDADAAADVLTVTGTARTADGQPAAGVRVTVVGWAQNDGPPPSVSGMTDADGRYVLRGLPHPHRQLVWLVAEGPDGAVGNAHVILLPESERRFDSKLVMAPSGRRALRFTDADGAPVAGVVPRSVTGGEGMERFILLKEWAAAAGSDWPASDADGRLTTPNLPVGEELRATFDPPDQHRQISDAFVVPAADVAADPHPVVVRRAGLFEVRVVPGEGAAPLPRDGYRVEVRGHGRVTVDPPIDERRSLNLKPDGSGVLVLKVPASGPEVETPVQYWRPGATNEALEPEDFGVEVTVTHPDLIFAPSSVTAVLDPGEREAKQVKALRRGTVTGRLVDPATGEPRGGQSDHFTVEAYIPATDGRRYVGAAGPGWMRVRAERSRATAEEDGHFAVDVPVGRVRLVAEGRGRSPLIPTLLERDVPPGGLDLGDVPLASAPELTGTVTTPDGEPVPGAVVWTTGSSLLTAPATVADAEGRFALQTQPLRFLREQAVPPGESVAVEIVAFDPTRPFEGTAKVRIVPGATPEPTTLRLEPQPILPPPDATGHWSQHAFSGRFFQDDPVPELPAAEVFAPDGSPADGPVTLEALRGQWVLLNFTATGSYRWDAAEAEVRAVGRAFADRLTVVNVHHASDSADRIAEVLAKQPAVGLTLRDADGAVQRAYGVQRMPTRILIDPEGRFQQVFASQQEVPGNLPRVVRQFVLAP